MVHPAPVPVRRRIAGIFWRIAALILSEILVLRLSSAVAEVARFSERSLISMAYRSMNACCCAGMLDDWLGGSVACHGTTFSHFTPE